MKCTASFVALAAGASATTFIGDGVPLIYATEPYPSLPFDGVQYNATVINGVAFNSSNEWPCMTAEKYFTILPTCAVQCLSGSFKNATLCPDDDFPCHCTTPGAVDLNNYVIPCMTAGIGTENGCSVEVVGQVANLVHASICPYFKAKTHAEAYGNCPAAVEQPSSAPEHGPLVKPSSSRTYWPRPTNVGPFGRPQGEGYSKPDASTDISKDAIPLMTSVQSTWTRECNGPTTFSRGTRTWTATEATALTVTDYPITWTKPFESGTWAPVADEAAVTAAAVSDPIETAATNVNGGFASSTTASFARPVEFMGGASSNKAVGVLAVAAGIGAILL